MFRSFKCWVIAAVAILGAYASQAQAYHPCLHYHHRCYAGWPYGYAGYWPHAYRPYTYYGPAYYSNYWFFTDPGGDRIKWEYARKLQAEAERFRIENRAALYDQALKEWDTAPTQQDRRERRKGEELREALNNPPLEMIRDARALNTVLEELKKLRARGVYGESVPLSDELLWKINVSSGDFAWKVVFLKEARRQWPVLLRRAELSSESQRLDGLIGEAVQQVVTGQVEPKTAAEIARLLEQVRQRLDEMASRMGEVKAPCSPTECIQASGFVEQLRSATAALQRPGARYYLTGRFAARGNTVAELVQHMAEIGLQFAPVTKGNEAAYRSLHRALADYHASAQPAGRGTMPAAVTLGK